LARAFREVCEDQPTAVCVFVGDREGRYSEALRGDLARTGLSSRCALLPVTANPYLWFATGDVFALTSDVEASPVSILEAMAFELPVVATSAFGVPELMEDARHGYLCVPNDVTDVARALDRALSASDQQRRELTFAAQERVRERHAPEPYARGLQNLLRRLSHEPDAPPLWDVAGVAGRGL